MTLLAGLCQQIDRGCLAGKKNESAVRNDFPDPDSRFNSVQSRHDHIAEYDIGTQGLRELDGGRPVGYGRRFKTLIIQNFGDYKTSAKPPMQ